MEFEKAVQGLCIIAVIGVLYFLPGLIGSRKRNANAIWVLNIFAGWTFIGWVVALVWACCNEEAKGVTK